MELDFKVLSAVCLPGTRVQVLAVFVYCTWVLQLQLRLRYFYLEFCSPFSRNPSMNIHNNFIWAKENAHAVIGINNQQFFVNVCIGISKCV